MDSRRLTAVLLLLVAATIGFVTAPASSGEHPWNSDSPVGDGKGTGSTGGSNVYFDTITVSDTAVVSGTLLSSSAGMSVWIVILTGVWSASWAM